MDDRGDPATRGGRALASLLLLAALAMPCLLYGSAYVLARATHRLVNYGDGHIMRAHAMSGFGFSWWEVAFLPATYTEEVFRVVFDIY